MKKNIVNIIGLLLSLVLFMVLFTSLLRNLKRINEGKRLIQKSEAKLLAAKQENEKLWDQLEIIQSEEYVEKQLRNKLGLVKEGEIVIVLPEADIVKKLAPIVPEEEEIKPKPNYLKWLEMFY